MDNGTLDEAGENCFKILSKLDPVDAILGAVGVCGMLINAFYRAGFCDKDELHVMINLIPLAIQNVVEQSEKNRV